MAKGTKKKGVGSYQPGTGGTPQRPKPGFNTPGHTPNRITHPAPLRGSTQNLGGRPISRPGVAPTNSNPGKLPPQQARALTTMTGMFAKGVDSKKRKGKQNVST